MTTEKVTQACLKVAHAYKLTNREIEVLQQLCLDGSHNLQLADKLGISIKTLKNHMAAIQTKMKCDSTRKVMSEVLRGMSEEKPEASPTCERVLEAIS